MAVLQGVTNKRFDAASLLDLLAKIKAAHVAIMGEGKVTVKPAVGTEGEGGYVAAVTRDPQWTSLLKLEQAIVDLSNSANADLEALEAKVDGLKIKKLDTAEGDYAATYQLWDKDNNKVGDSINIAKDQHLKRAELGTKPAVGTEGEADYEPAEDALVLTWYVTEEGTTKDVVTYIPVGDFLREAEVGEGMEIVNGKYNVKIADASENVTIIDTPAQGTKGEADYVPATTKEVPVIAVDENGVKVANVQAAIDLAVETAAGNADEALEELKEELLGEGTVTTKEAVAESGTPGEDDYVPASPAETRDALTDLTSLDQEIVDVRNELLAEIAALKAQAQDLKDEIAQLKLDIADTLNTVVDVDAAWEAEFDDDPATTYDPAMPTA